MNPAREQFRFQKQLAGGIPLIPAFSPTGGEGARMAEEGAAFTLIEMLIAVAISATVLAVVSSLFFSALRLRASASAAAEETLPVDRAVAIMKHDLLGIVPVGVLAGPMGNDAVGIGMTAPIILEIFTGSGVIDADSPWGDVLKIDYSLQPPTNKNNYAGLSLMRGVTHNLLPVTAVPPDQQTLLEDVQNLKFSYYDGTNWNDTWSTTLSNIPIAIRVSIDFAKSSTDTRVKPQVQFLVPVVTWSNTNSITNQLSGN
jgi:prepilin-type N-terminal cleavage/methylation domain-containing protein